jgi:hypothetical protein
MILKDDPHKVWVRPERKDDLQRPHRVDAVEKHSSPRFQQRQHTCRSSHSSGPVRRVDTRQPAGEFFNSIGQTRPFSLAVTRSALRQIPDVRDFASKVLSTDEPVRQRSEKLTQLSLLPIRFPIRFSGKQDQT